MYILVITQRNSQNMFKRHCFKNRKLYLNFLLEFWNLHKILHVFKKKISCIASIFRRLLGPVNVVTWMCKSSWFGTPFLSQRVHGCQTLLKSIPQHFYLTFPLIVDHMYSGDIWDKFSQHVQTALSSKTENIFWRFYCVLGIYMKFCGSWKKTSAS